MQGDKRPPKKRKSSKKPKAAAAPKKAAVKAAKAVKPPKKEFSKRNSTWYIENFTSGAIVEVEFSSAKEQAYIYNCDGATIVLAGKGKAVSVDKCKKTAIKIDSVISSIELVNCQRMRLQVEGSAPSLAIDKTDGFLAYLSADASKANIVTSKSSEMNVAIPHPDDPTDWLEMPIPEQFQHQIVDSKLTSDVSDLYAH